MRWKGREQSSNVQDRRGMPVGMAVGGGGIGVLVIALIAMFLGADPAAIRNIVGEGPPRQAPAANAGAGVNDEARQFIGVVLKSTEDVWASIFQQNVQGGRYTEPKLNIFSGSIRSGCGVASAAVGPFYCPADQQIYIDPAFFEDLKRRHRADGDFAQAYVIAHEVSHHVQSLLGFSNVVQEARARRNKIEINQASVRLELQADFLAGVWAHHAHKEYQLLEPGDIEEGINAANQIGDDTLMREAGAAVRPERFTHGTSKQRVRWFTAGMRSGDINDCQQLFELNYSEL